MRPTGLPRLLAGLDLQAGPMSLARHERVHGLVPVHSPDRLIELVRRSGLRGRGGADFPTARKLAAVAESRSRERVVVVNGSETEPASQKDWLLLHRLPQLVLDGAILAANAVGAQEVIVKVTGPADELVAAIAERHERIPIQVIEGPTGYVAGEESAVISFLGGGAPKPKFVPPRPHERGYRRRPTLLNNPETFAQIALIARHGDAWFRELGTPADPGSVLVTVSGAVAAPGVYELAFGTRIDDLLAAAGGSTEPLRALLVGGYFGTWIDGSDAFELRLARGELRSAGCALGSGVLFALGESACGLHESARLIDYLARQSTGQCGPCVHGLRAIADSVAELAAGTAPLTERDRVLRWATEIRGRGACHHPDGAVRLVESALRVFADELRSHQHGICGARPAGLPLGEAIAAVT